ncbi:MAG: hypothetical protein AAGC46_16820 [Solirubrobacteraceae bacterium]|nr:hypothetical protein [Patulibacter sp.]
MTRSVVSRFRRRARTAALAFTIVAAGCGVVAGAGYARLPLGEPFQAVADNPADSMLDVPIDDQTYDPATHCVKNPTKGALALVRWLPKVTPRGVNWGINRCEIWGPHSASLHAEGRAVDWHLDVHDAADRAEAEGLIKLLLAPDANGEPHALARRLGVQGLIFNCQAWWGGEGLQKYSACLDKHGKLDPHVDDTTAHKNHVHLELSKAGAKLRTSFWTEGPGRAIARSLK